MCLLHIVAGVIMLMTARAFAHIYKSSSYPKLISINNHFQILLYLAMYCVYYDTKKVIKLQWNSPYVISNCYIVKLLLRPVRYFLKEVFTLPLRYFREWTSVLIYLICHPRWTITFLLICLLRMRRGMIIIGSAIVTVLLRVWLHKLYIKQWTLFALYFSFVILTIKTKYKVFVSYYVLHQSIKDKCNVYKSSHSFFGFLFFFDD